MKVPFPKEHGGWPILIVSWVVGAFAIGGGLAERLLLLGSMLLLFTAAEPAGRIAGGRRRLRHRLKSVAWTAAFAIPGCVFAWPLLTEHTWPLIAVGVAALLIGLFPSALFPPRKRRSLAAELLGVAALTLAGPAAAIPSGVAPRELAALWLFLFVFFGGRVLFVRMVVRRMRRKEAEAAAAGQAVRVFHGAGYVALTIMVVQGSIVPLSLLAHIPSAVEVALIGRVGSLPKSAKVLGWTEAAKSLLFALLAIRFW